jgi:hypothetical protein
MNAALVIPICCVCNRVRELVQAIDNSERWGTLDVYLNTHRVVSGEYQLTHTYCPSCATQFTKPGNNGNPISRQEPETAAHTYENPAAATILEVFLSVQKCDLDMLVRACPTLTWNQIFSEVDRLSRVGQLRLSYLGHGRYSVELPETADMPLVAQT